MIRLLLISFILLSADRLAKAAELPSFISESQRLLALQNVCSPNWPELASDKGVRRIELGHGWAAFFVPCSNFSLNLGWSVYLESQTPGGVQYKQVLFVNHTRYQGRVFADHLVYNVDWIESIKAIASTYNYDNLPQCGTVAKYVWNENQQTFIVRTIGARDNCHSEDQPSIIIKRQRYNSFHSGEKAPTPSPSPTEDGANENATSI